MAALWAIVVYAFVVGVGAFVVFGMYRLATAGKRDRLTPRAG